MPGKDSWEGGIELASVNPGCNLLDDLGTTS
jgi:hypothetical protein